jgi:translation initiation factor IF-3
LIDETPFWLIILKLPIHWDRSNRTERTGPVFTSLFTFPSTKEPTIEKTNRINEQIRIPKVRVIDAEGHQLGVLETREALTRAREAGLDLVEVAPEATPPVCRIMDFGKFKYEKAKRQTKSKQHHSKLKEIRLRPKTGEHDIEFKVKQAIGFLQHNDKVQVTVSFRGRENAHVDEGRRVMDQIIEMLADFGKVESRPSQQQKRIICTITPNKS